MSASPHIVARGIHGYDYGAVAPSPVSLEELNALKQSADFSEDDERWLREAASILSPQAEAIVDSWRAVIGKQPELARVFFGPDGKPDEDYKAAVKKRFVQWVKDVCERPYDQQWLDYQHEIGLRHTPAKKNQTDHAQTAPVVPLRYLIAFTAITCTSIHNFLASSGRSGKEIQRMEDAWTKSMLLHLALWSRPYVAESLW